MLQQQNNRKKNRQGPSSNKNSGQKSVDDAVLFFIFWKAPPPLPPKKKLWKKSPLFEAHNVFKLLINICWWNSSPPPPPTTPPPTPHGMNLQCDIKGTTCFLKCVLCSMGWTQKLKWFCFKMSHWFYIKFKKQVFFSVHWMTCFARRAFSVKLQRGHQFSRHNQLWPSRVFTSELW